MNSNHDPIRRSSSLDLKATERPFLIPNHSNELKKNAEARKKTFAAFLGFSIPEALNFGTIFFMHFTKAFLDFLFNTPMRFFVFPAAALYGLTKAGLLWRQFHLVYKNYKIKQATLEETRISFLQALWETLNGLGTTGAVVTGIIGFFIGASVGMGISITFNFFLATSTAICAAYSGYYGYTAHIAHQKWKIAEKAWLSEQRDIDENHPDYKRFKKTHPDHLEFQKRQELSINHALITGIVALLTVGVILAMVTGFPAIGAAIGIAGCLASTAFSAYQLYKLLHNPKAQLELEKCPSTKHPHFSHKEQLTCTVNTKMQLIIGLKRNNNLPDLTAMPEVPPNCIDCRLPAPFAVPDHNQHRRYRR